MQFHPPFPLGTPSQPRGRCVNHLLKVHTHTFTSTVNENGFRRDAGHQWEGGCDQVGGGWGGGVQRQLQERLSVRSGAEGGGGSGGFAQAMVRKVH